MKRSLFAAASLAIFMLAAGLSAHAAQKTPGVIKAESVQKFQANGARAISGPAISDTIQDVADSFIPMLAPTISAQGVFSNTQGNLNVRMLINGADPAAWYNSWHPGAGPPGNFSTEAITGAIDVPATATVHESAGVAGYVRSRKSSAYGSDAGGFFQGEAYANGVSVLGVDSECVVGAGFTSGISCQNLARTRIYSPGVTAIGWNISLDGDTLPAVGSALQISSSNLAGGWSYGLTTTPGATPVGIALQQVAAGASQNSQSIQLFGKNAASVAKGTTIYADLDGNLRLEPQAWASVIGGLGVGVTNPTGKLEVASGVVATSQPIKFTQTWNDGGASVAFSTFEIRNTNVSSNTAASDIFAVYGGAAGTFKMFNVAGDGNTTVLALTATSLISSPQVAGGTAANSTLTLLSAMASGTTDKIVLGTNLTARWNILNGGEFQPAAANSYDIGDATNTVRNGYFGGFVRTGAAPVGSLPTCNAAAKGSRYLVTDSNATLTAGIGAPVAAGGANEVPVTCAGANWVIGANDNAAALKAA